MKTVVTAIAALTLTSAYAPERVLEAYGDSLTHGFLTNSYIEMSSPDEVKTILTNLVTYFFTKDGKHRAKFVHPELAWPAYFSKLFEQDYGERIEVFNYAISGATARGMLNQVLRAPRRDALKVGFFFIGHNDLCANKLPPQQLADTYIREVEAAIALWDAKNQGAVGFLIPVAEVHRVYETLRDYVWYTGALGEYKCENSWRIYFPYCVPNYKLAAKGRLTEYLEPRISAMNSQLDQLASRWNDRSERNRYRYIREVQHLDMQPRHFAVDCYHLSSTGQEEFANLLYEAVRRDLFSSSQ